MGIVVSLLACIVFIALFRKPLQKHPGVFYALAASVDLLFLMGGLFEIPLVFWRTVLALHMRCLIAFSFFAVVMYIGVLKEGGRLRCALAPIRAELSIVATILAAGHVANYSMLFASRVAGAGGLRDVAVLAVGVLLVLLLAVLAVTSLRAVKVRMSTGAWKRIQRLSYVFWGLLFGHVVLMLVPSALSGGSSALESVFVYAVVFGAYLLLRVRRAYLDGRGSAGD